MSPRQQNVVISQATANRGNGGSSSVPSYWLTGSENDESRLSDRP
ncbi:hypothetical protein KJE20_11826 [Pyrenophora tritici-repentis]|nr:hypothetical protein KJE20_11826 [Pyrenophora tritici-repentis]